MNMHVGKIVGEPAVRWFAFRCASRREFAARETLRLREIPSFVPTEIKKIRPQRERRRRVLKELPMIPGYVMVAFEPGDDWKWERMSRLRHVIFGVVAFAGKPAELDRDGMARLIENSGREPLPDPAPYAFKAGDSVRVATGPFEGLQARIESMKKARAIIDLLNNGRHIDVPLSALELA